MIVRFCLYSVFKNLRFFEPFFFIYLLAGPAVGGPELSYFQVGLLIGYQKLLTGLAEIPFGVLTDRLGRRSALVLCFGCYAVAFPLYATASRWPEALQLLTLYLAQTAFGLGEALRTGSHKAIMLDWADQTGRSQQATSIVGTTRFFSKSAAGLSALVGGGLLYWSGRFEWLFWAATVPALAGALLMTTYPKWLEGEMSRQAPSEPAATPRGWMEQTRRLWAAPAVLGLMFQSIVFESQFKMAQHYLQPYLKMNLQEKDVAVVGAAGALLIGTYYLIQESLGGLSSMAAVGLERRLGGGSAALRLIHLTAVALSTIIAVSLFRGWLILGMAGFVGLTLLQNARRPIFVSQFNTVMDKPQRTTTLSIESQGRSFTYSALAPLTGLLADTYGLGWALATVPAILVVGLVLAKPKAAVASG